MNEIKNSSSERMMAGGERGIRRVSGHGVRSGRGRDKGEEGEKEGAEGIGDLHERFKKTYDKENWADRNVNWAANKRDSSTIFATPCWT